MPIPIYRIALIRSGSQRTKQEEINTPEDAYKIFRDFIGQADREHLVVMTLDAKNRPLGLNLVSIGDLTSAMSTSREVYKLAVLQNAASIILAHNHPSGTADISKGDSDTTWQLHDAGVIMGIELLDHIIIGDREFVSMWKQEHMVAYKSSGRARNGYRK
jgi:DNA repair protein RadC